MLGADETLASPAVPRPVSPPREWPPSVGHRCQVSTTKAARIRTPLLIAALASTARSRQRPCVPQPQEQPRSQVGPTPGARVLCGPTSAPAFSGRRKAW